MAIKAFELFGTVSVENRTSTELRKIDRDVDRTKKGLSDLSKTKVQIDTKAAEASVGRLRKHFADVRSDVAKSLGMGGGGAGVGDFLSRTGANMLGNLATGAITGAVDKMRDLNERGLQYLDTVKMADLAFKGLLGSQERAVALTDKLLKFSRQSFYEDGPTLRYAQALMAVGVSAETVTQSLTAMGNALAFSGRVDLGAQERFIIAVTQMRSNEYLRSEELNTQLMDLVPTAKADLAKVLGFSTQGELMKAIEQRRVKSAPAMALLEDLWLNDPRFKGKMDFAGTQTVEGLRSSKRSAEDAAAAAVLAGGDVRNISAGGPADTYLKLLQEQTKLIDQFAKGGPGQALMGDVLLGYLRAKAADDQMLFDMTKGGATSTAGTFTQNFLQKPAGVGGVPGPGMAGAALAETVGVDKPLLIDLPQFMKTGKSEGYLAEWVAGLFGGAAGSAVEAVDAAKGPAKAAGAGLGGAVVEGMKSPEGLDSNSPSKKAIAEGQNVREGIVRGLMGLEGGADVGAAGASLADELFGGFGAGRSKYMALGMTAGQARNRERLDAVIARDPAFLDTLKRGAAARGVNPDDMLNLIAIESNFNKSVVNKWGYGGLGQVGRNERKALGLPVGDTAFKQLLESQSESWQLDHVLFPFLDMKLRQNPGALRDGRVDLFELYAMWGSGHATGNPDAVHAARGGKRAAMYRNNPLWDPNKDGVIREGEFGTAAMKALGAGQKFSVVGITTEGVPVFAGASVTGQAGGMKWGDYRKAMGLPPSTGLVRQRQTTLDDITVDFGNAESTSPRRRARRRAGTRGASVTEIHDPVSIVEEVTAAMDPLPVTFGDLATSVAQVAKIELPKLGDAVAGVSGALSEEEKARLRAEAVVGGGSKKKRDKLFDSALTREGIAEDFAGGAQGFFANLGWEKPGNLGRQFLVGFARDIQARWAHDLSAGLTGALFGQRGEDGKLSGGLFGGGGGIGSFFKKVFGSLFGGFRASGGPVSTGRLYMVGEQGPELFMPGPGGGHVYNSSQLAGAGERDRLIVAFGDRAVAEAMDSYFGSPRGRRAQIFHARYNRKMNRLA